MESALTKLCRRLMLGAVGLVFVCMPWLWCAERLGWSQRPIHLLQTFLAVPVAFIAGALFLWLGRSAPADRGWRPFAWVVVVASGLWVAFLAYVLFGADFRWMDQR